MAGHGQRPAPSRHPDLVSDHLACLQLPTGHDDVGAGTGKGNGNLAPEPATATGDNRHPVAQAEQIERVSHGI
jgi:hypothetical protein